MFTGITSHGGALITAIGLLTGAAILHSGAATADPDQDQKFLTLLADNDIPAVDNDDGLIDTAHKACGKLDDGMPVGDLVELMRNNGFATNPLARFYPQGRVTRTIDRFISAAVQAYCPYDRGKIASIMPGTATGSSEPMRPGAVYTHVVHDHGIALVSVIGPIPSGEVPPSNPPPAPALPSPPPQQVHQVPEQPPVPRSVPPAPQRPQQVQPPPQQVEPPPQEAEPPPPEAGPSPQQAEPPPPAEPSPPPTEPPPTQPHPPGFVRLAP